MSHYKVSLKGLPMSQNCCLCGTVTDGERGPLLDRFCEACYRTLPRFHALLESLDSPAALIARDYSVLYSNDLLRRVFAKVDKEPQTIGEAIDCVHAVSRGRCGETFACLQCGLRRSVELSRLTGERLVGIPAQVRQNSGINQTLKLSTENAGEAIILMFALEPEEPSTS